MKEEIPENEAGIQFDPAEMQELAQRARIARERSPHDPTPQEAHNTIVAEKYEELPSPDLESPEWSSLTTWNDRIEKVESYYKEFCEQDGLDFDSMEGQWAVRFTDGTWVNTPGWVRHYIEEVDEDK